MPLGTNTTYNTWDTTGLIGPRRHLPMDRYAALWGRIKWGEFLDRYSYLEGDTCQAWTGEEDTGFDCDAACDQLADVCPGTSVPSCETQCETFPRSITDCMQALTSCDLASCTRGWAEL